MDRAPTTKRLLTFSMRGWAARIKNREKGEGKGKRLSSIQRLSRATIVREWTRDVFLRQFHSRWNYTRGWKFVHDLKGVAATSSLSREFFFLPSICTRQLPSSRSLACYARLVNKFYRPRWQSSRMTQAFAPASLISITIGRLQSSPINVRFIFKQWNRLYDDLIRFDRAPIALLFVSLSNCNSFTSRYLLVAFNESSSRSATGCLFNFKNPSCIFWKIFMQNREIYIFCILSSYIFD